MCARFANYRIYMLLVKLAFVSLDYDFGVSVLISLISRESSPLLRLRPGFAEESEKVDMVSLARRSQSAQTVLRTWNVKESILCPSLNPS